MATAMKSNPDKEERGSKEDQFCQPCTAEGLQAEAVGFCSNCMEYLCDDCFKHHTKPSLTKHHVLKCTLKEMVVQKATDKCSEKCTKHEKVIKYFCRSHNFFGCSVCITLQHRLCEDVEYISEVSQSLMDSSFYLQFTQHMTELEQKAEKLVPESEQKKEFAEENYVRLVVTIKEFRKQINDAFDELERNSSEQALRAKDKESGKFQCITAACREMLLKIQETRQKLKDLEGKGQLCDAYVVMKRTDGELRSMESRLATLTYQCQLVEYNFCPNKLPSLNQHISQLEEHPDYNYLELKCFPHKCTPTLGNITFQVKDSLRNCDFNKDVCNLKQNINLLFEEKKCSEEELHQSIVESEEECLSKKMTKRDRKTLRRQQRR